MDNTYKLILEPNERTIPVRPIGIKYICPHCHDGEMIASDSDPFIISTNGDTKKISRTHYCDKCGARMDLPKTYPYIEWVPAIGPVSISYREDKNETT